MGYEAKVRLKTGGGWCEGKALLEADEIRILGACACRIARADIQDVTVQGAMLTIKTAKGAHVLNLGAKAAALWATKLAAGPPSRLEKLGLKPGTSITLRNIQDPALADALAQAGCAVITASKAADIILLGVDSPRWLREIGAIAQKMRKDAALWVIRVKGPAAPVTEGEIRAAGSAAGLVTNKTMRFSATHTGERFVIPLAKRTQPKA